MSRGAWSVNKGLFHRAGLLREIGPAGVLTVLGSIALLLAVGVLFTEARPPSVEELERDIWTEWARLATDSLQRTLVDQLVEDRRAAGQTLVETMGDLIDKRGQLFVVRTQVRYIRIRDQAGAVFAEWQAGPQAAQSTGWKDLAIDLVDPDDRKVGVLEVGYRFYGGGLDYLPNIRRLAALHDRALGLVVLLASVVVVAVLANLSRLRERAGRLESQQVTLDLARQMCHELRNGLWAFSMEANNLRQLFDRVDEHCRELPVAVRKGAERIGLEPDRWERFQRTLHKALAQAHVDPQSDLLPANAMARESHQQIESFSRYLNLTVEELDRNLLGAGGWEPTRLRLSEAWAEACNLLEMRFRSAGVAQRSAGVAQRAQVGTEDDWVLADRRALVHAFVNLAKNAIEAMREQESNRELVFEVEADPQGHKVECRVWNSGPPIPEGLLPHVFEPGFSTKAGAGRGRGLALVRDLVERMNGDLAVRSSQAEGTCFRLVFPYDPPADRQTRQGP